MGFACVGLWRDRLKPHQAHEPLHMLAVDLNAFVAQRLAQFAPAVERPLQVNLVNATHQAQLLGAGTDGLVVQPRAPDGEQLALPSERNLLLNPNHGPALPPRRRPSPRAKESRATMSSPIFFTSSSSRSVPPPVSACCWTT